MLYIVSQTIVSGNIDGGEPVEVNWYKGESLPLAMSAMAQAVTRAEDQQEVPESVRVHTLEVRLDMQADCPWRGVGYNQRVWWAAPYVCGGREVEHPFGTLCGNHSKAWAEAQENMIVDHSGFTGATSSTDENNEVQ